MKILESFFSFGREKRNIRFKLEWDNLVDFYNEGETTIDDGVVLVYGGISGENIAPINSQDFDTLLSFKAGVNPGEVTTHTSNGITITLIVADYGIMKMSEIMNAIDEKWSS